MLGRSEAKGELLRKEEGGKELIRLLDGERPQWDKHNGLASLESLGRFCSVEPT
jgi:hypothetical protein